MVLETPRQSTTATPLTKRGIRQWLFYIPLFVRGVPSLRGGVLK